ncbi:hypothetical protein [Bacillus bombysepticus]|uniref:hypothetical protein n=1 Tax=Bacillus bombysepticus TaxID=658666 RepID=UPI0030192E40
MKNNDLSFLNKIFNFVFGPILFWIYYCCLNEGPQRTRQLGNIVNQTIQGHIFLFFTMALSISTAINKFSGPITEFFARSNPLVIGLLFIINVILHFKLGWGYCKQYTKQVIDEALYVDTSEENLHDVPLVKIIGYTIDNVVLKIITFVIGVFAIISGISNLTGGYPVIGIISLLIAAPSLYMFKRLKDRDKLVGKEYEKSVEAHYSKMEKIKKASEPIDFFNK